MWLNTRAGRFVKRPRIAWYAIVGAAVLGGSAARFPANAASALGAPQSPRTTWRSLVGADALIGPSAYPAGNDGGKVSLREPSVVTPYEDVKTAALC